MPPSAGRGSWKLHTGQTPALGSCGIMELLKLEKITSSSRQPALGLAWTRLELGVSPQICQPRSCWSSPNSQQFPLSSTCRRKTGKGTKLARPLNLPKAPAGNWWHHSIGFSMQLDLVSQAAVGGETRRERNEGVRLKAQGLPLHCYYPLPIPENDSKPDSRPIFLQD